MTRWKKWCVALLLIVSSCLTAEQQLKVTDVRPLVQELLMFHVDQGNFSAQMLRRSLKTYSDHFDPYRLYFLEDELNAAMNPPTQEMTAAVDGYYRDQYPLHENVLMLAQSSVQRARGIRTELSESWIALFDSPDQWNAPYERHQTYATSEEALKDRWNMIFRHFLQEQRDAWSVQVIQEKREQVLALFNRRFAATEQLVLLQNDQGMPLGATEQTHQKSVWVLKSLARSLDPHTEYFDPVESYNIRIQLEKGLCGIGVVLEEGFDGIRIVDLISGGPAAESKQLQPNDLIVSIDGEKANNMTFKKMLQHLRGHDGSVVTLGIRRISADGKSEQTNTVTLRRGAVVLKDNRIDVSAEPFGDGIIGRIALHAFYEGDRGVSSEADVMEALRSLRAAGPLRGLVLDMRNNTGGFLTQAIRVAGLFITSGVVVQSKYGDGQVRLYRDLDGYAYYTGPLVVLTSRMTASAAEIVAQALQDYGVAVVVGDDRTFGKGSIQNQTITSDNAASSFKVTVARYYTVSGKSPQRDGVEADIVVPTSWAFEPVGERYLDYALTPDSVPPAFNDPLVDINNRARPWYERYYLPSVQAKTNKWQDLLPQLRRNSANRIEKSQNYQRFLTARRNAATGAEATRNWGTEDLPLQEAMNIVKDMVLLQTPKSPATKQAAQVEATVP
jgi:carboxyl-terminal processing protease